MGTVEVVTTAQLVNILLVDDKQENLVALEQLLARPDRQLICAHSGNEALRLLLKHDFAVVLLDVEMPNMDGYEVAELMRSAERTRLVPIIFVTAGDRSEERVFRGYEAGAVDFLYKPIGAQTLRSKVDVFVDLYRKTTELTAANASLERTTALLHEKVSDLENVSQTLSHDLRAPLRSIRAFTQILAESLSGKLDAEQTDALDRVLRGTARMTNMIEELFDLLKVSGDDTPYGDVDVSAVLVDVLENLRNEIEYSGARITHGELPTVHANRLLVSQILQNLVSNAVKFCGNRDPAVQITADHRGDAWEFAVRDTGVGILPEDRERVFRPFERVGKTAAGTGVGLALCKRAVEKLGGQIWIDSEPGSGTTFRFTIPHRKGDQTSQARKTPSR
jgi:two-component system, sensor histidine kinase and response regulator